jgi:imidazole glycerol-phosphate synthase subunit HisH
MVNILDLGYGNSASIANTLDCLGYPYELIDHPNKLQEGVLIIPGVGSISAFNNKLSRLNWSENIKHFAKGNNKVIGICLGLHALTAYSEESDGMKCMGFLGKKVSTVLVDKEYKRSNTGWLPFSIDKDFLYQSKWDPFYDRSRKKSIKGRVFYNHIYGVQVSKNPSISIHGRKKFVALTVRDNFMGIQFHPEKSQEFGRSLLEFIL